MNVKAKNVMPGDVLYDGEKCFKVVSNTIVSMHEIKLTAICPDENLYRMALYEIEPKTKIIDCRGDYELLLAEEYLWKNQ